MLINGTLLLHTHHGEPPVACKCNRSSDFRLLEGTYICRRGSVQNQHSDFTALQCLCGLSCFSSHCVEQKTARLHGGTDPSCISPLFDEPRMSSHASILPASLKNGTARFIYGDGLAMTVKVESLICVFHLS